MRRSPDSPLSALGSAGAVERSSQSRARRPASVGRQAPKTTCAVIAGSSRRQANMIAPMRCPFADIVRTILRRILICNKENFRYNRPLVRYPGNPACTFVSATVSPTNRFGRSAAPAARRRRFIALSACSRNAANVFRSCGRFSAKSVAGPMMGWRLRHSPLHDPATRRGGSRSNMIRGESLLASRVRSATLAKG